jgi:hypothetical protein
VVHKTFIREGVAWSTIVIQEGECGVVHSSHSGGRVWRGPQQSFRREGVAWSTTVIQEGGCGVVHSNHSGGRSTTVIKEGGCGVVIQEGGYGVIHSSQCTRFIVAIQEGGSTI